MAPSKYESQVRLTPAKAAMSGLSREEIQRFFYQTQQAREFLGTQAPEDAKCENFMDIHIVGQRDSKYMKYQHKHAPLLTRENCEHTRAYVGHDLSDHAVAGEIADLVKSKQGVGRPRAQPAFCAQTKYHDDYRRFTRAEARAAVRQGYVPIIPCTDDGRPSHPLRGTDRLEEICSHEHEQFQAHPLNLAKAEKASAPKASLGPVADNRPNLVALSTAYREEFFSEKGVPRRPLRKPTRCKSAPTLRGPIQALPNWMRQAVASGHNWSASRVVARPPAVAEALSSDQRRRRPASASAVGSERPSEGRARPPSALARMETRPKQRRPVSAGAIRSSSGASFQ